MGFCEALARGATVGRFVVQELRILRRAAALRQRAHGHKPLIRPDADPQLSADAQLLGGFRARPVHLYLAARDCGGGYRARLEEARGPEPTIETDTVRVHAQRYYQPR